MVKITLPDGTEQKHPKGVTGTQVAEGIGAGLAKAALAIKVNGEIRDLFLPIEEDATIEIITSKTEDGKKVLWHSSAHILAEATLELFPGTKLAIGPPIAEGFYYDMDPPQPFTQEDLEKIEERMREIIKRDEKPEKFFITEKEARSKYKDNPYKIDIIDKMEKTKEEEKSGKISFYRQGRFEDMCRGPHMSRTGNAADVKLYKLSGAYWRGDSNNPMLQRIYGITFTDKKEVKAWVKRREEAEKRNHMKIGAAMDLYSMQKEAPGSIFFHPRGTVIYNLLVEFLRKEQTKRGYVEINTPLILNKSLWLQSGHWDHYKENMYFTEIDEQAFAVKPMNCPCGILVYKQGRYTYKDLPLRLADFGTVHRL